MNKDSYENHNELLSFLNKLDFTDEVSRLYLTLIKHGPLTLLEASRLAKIERTKLYRFIEVWKDSGLIEEQLAHKTRLLKACGLDRIKFLLQEQKLKIKFLEKSLPEFTKSIYSLSTNLSPTKTLYYNSQSGLRQMAWNVLGAKTELQSYVYHSYQEALGQQFFNEWAKEFIVRKIKYRELRHPSFLKSVDLKHLEYKHLGPRYLWKIAPSTLTITHGLDIYNNIVAIYYWHDEEFFGIEIYNEQIANMQLSIFNTLWTMAK